MALQATHIRFARELIADANPENAFEYYSGAIYPDSRYYTKIPREATHRSGAPQLPFSKEQTDFQKGWATHEFYDEAGGVFLKELFNISEKISSINENWIKITAVKMIEDVESCRLLGDDKHIFEKLEPIGAVNGEDTERLNLFYRTQEDIYTDEQFDIESYRKTFKLSPDIPVAELYETVGKVRQDKKMMEDISRIFYKVKAEYEKMYK